ncbi:SH3 domain-containing protein [Micromonospora sp. NPDC049559]|uniref:SH3 domain-containing protein n=1 Tax=Micromonospora sp. NPDC049559 TaxID=3155923 RepID=UPI00342DC695
MLAGAGLALASVLLLASPAAAAVNGTVRTSGIALNVRSAPSTSASIVGTVANGATISIDCQITGTTVTGYYGTSSLWDHIAGKGYVSDTYVYTGSNGWVAPACDAGDGGDTSECDVSTIHNPRTCAEAVTWANQHITTNYVADYYQRCDHIMGLAYGYSASGFASAKVHWESTPSQYKHPGDRDAPVGTLVFFTTGQYGHVAIVTAPGQLASNDIHGNGTFTYTTIAELEQRWGAGYLGWTNPWFNH